MRDQEWDSTTAELDSLDLGQLVLSLLGLDSVDGESALGVVDKTEVLASLLDGDDVHEAGGEGDVGSDLVVDLDESLHHDGSGLAVVEGILESVSDEDDQGHAVSELVRTGRGLGSVGAGQLVKQPVRGGAEALLVLLATRKLERRNISTPPTANAAGGEMTRCALRAIRLAILYTNVSLSVELLLTFRGPWCRLADFSAVLRMVDKAFCQRSEVRKDGPQLFS